MHLLLLLLLVLNKPIKPKPDGNTPSISVAAWPDRARGARKTQCLQHQALVVLPDPGYAA